MSIKSKRIYVLYTGGTIGMVNTDHGFAPQKEYLVSKIKTIADFYHDDMPEFMVHEYDELIDSANIKPENWLIIAQDILTHYDQYDGFVVLHGTDTLCYSASALSFLLKNLSKPVICTGSQIPISELRSDAADNILHSLIFAANKEIKEVCVYFNKQLMRGNRTVKVNASALDAFKSPNYPLLGEIGIDIITYKERLFHFEKEAGALQTNALSVPKIAMLTIFPGIDADILRKVLQAPLQGLVLKTYGAGNMMNVPEINDVLSQACQRGVIIINCTQCLKGNVKMGAYEAASGLVKAGAVSAHDMTDEAALTKLFYLLSIPEISIEEVKAAFKQNLRGEVTLK